MSKRKGRRNLIWFRRKGNGRGGIKRDYCRKISIRCRNPGVIWRGGTKSAPSSESL